MAADVGDERSAALAKRAVGVDAPGEALGHQVGVPPLGRQVEQLLEVAAVLGVAGHVAEVVHADDCIRSVCAADGKGPAARVEPGGRRGDGQTASRYDFRMLTSSMLSYWTPQNAVP